MGTTLKRKRPHENVTIARKDIFNLFVIVILISVGTGLLSTAIGSLMSENPWVLLIVSIFVTLLAASFSIWALTPYRKFDRKFKGIVIAEKQNTPVEIYLYDFSKEMGRYIKALCSENKALSRRWSETEFFSGNGPSRKITPSGELAK